MPCGVFSFWGDCSFRRSTLGCRVLAWGRAEDFKAVAVSTGPRGRAGWVTSKASSVPTHSTRTSDKHPQRVATPLCVPQTTTLILAGWMVGCGGEKWFIVCYRKRCLRGLERFRHCLHLWLWEFWGFEAVDVESAQTTPGLYRRRAVQL